MRNPLFWPLFHLGLFEIDLGYWSSKLKMSLGYWSSKRKRYWSSKWKMSLGYWSSAFFWPFCQGRFFFQRAGREGSDQNFFLPRVPKFKSVQTGWPHHLSFYTPFTQAQEITVKDLKMKLAYPWNIYCPKLKEYICSSYLEQVQSGSNQVCPVWLFGLVVFYKFPSNVLLSSKDRPNQNKHCTHMSKAWYLLEILTRFWM